MQCPLFSALERRAKLALYPLPGLQARASQWKIVFYSSDKITITWSHACMHKPAQPVLSCFRGRWLPDRCQVFYGDEKHMKSSFPGLDRHPEPHSLHWISNQCGPQALLMQFHQKQGKKESCHQEDGISCSLSWGLHR